MASSDRCLRNLGRGGLCRAGSGWCAYRRLIEAFAAGALLAMLADTLLPEAYKVEKVFTGPLVVIGFAISLGLSAA